MDPDYDEEGGLSILDPESHQMKLVVVEAKKDEPEIKVHQPLQRRWRDLEPAKRGPNLERNAAMNHRAGGVKSVTTVLEG